MPNSLIGVTTAPAYRKASKQIRGRGGPNGPSLLLRSGDDTSKFRRFGYMLVADPDYVLALYPYPYHNSNDRPTKPTDFEVSNTLPARYRAPGCANTHESHVLGTSSSITWPEGKRNARNGHSVAGRSNAGHGRGKGARQPKAFHGRGLRSFVSWAG